jgi:hypothetical protein
VQFALPAPVRIDDAAARVTPAPRELGLWTLPVYARTPKRTSVWLDVTVSGLGGRRVFSKRVRTVPMRVPRRLTLLVAVASLGLSWVWGGGLWVRVPASQRLGDPGERRRTGRSIDV